MYFVKPPDPPPILAVWMFLKDLFRVYYKKGGLKNGMDFCRVCHNLDRITGTRPCYCDSVIKEEETMPILFAITGSALGCFAEGAILGASVYLVSRGVRNPLKNRQ